MRVRTTVLPSRPGFLPMCSLPRSSFTCTHRFDHPLDMNEEPLLCFFFSHASSGCGAPTVRTGARAGRGMVLRRTRRVPRAASAAARTLRARAPSALLARSEKTAAKGCGELRCSGFHPGWSVGPHAPATATTVDAFGNLDGGHH